MNLSIAYECTIFHDNTVKREVFEFETWAMEFAVNKALSTPEVVDAATLEVSNTDSEIPSTEQIVSGLASDGSCRITITVRPVPYHHRV